MFCITCEGRGILPIRLVYSTKGRGVGNLSWPLYNMITNKQIHSSHVSKRLGVRLRIGISVMVGSPASLTSQTYLWYLCELDVFTRSEICFYRTSCDLFLRTFVRESSRNATEFVSRQQLI
jgi:hypothetical protein